LRSSTSLPHRVAPFAPTLVLCFAVSLFASDTKEQSLRIEEPAKVLTASAAQSSSTARRTTRRLASSRRTSYKRRIASMRVQPERVREIQQALQDAGYFNAEPSGKYDEATKDAMRRYQADNGFPTTGLPESRTLMKLGLGPHPLPEDADPLKIAAAEAPAESSAELEAEEAAVAEESDTNNTEPPANE
jgi:peptidoglycan hydrolase-like protein with peptidoglycan-binding domain